jgi:hypothetical protein
MTLKWVLENRNWKYFNDSTNGVGIGLVGYLYITGANYFCFPMWPARLVTGTIHISWLRKPKIIITISIMTRKKPVLATYYILILPMKTRWLNRSAAQWRPPPINSKRQVFWRLSSCGSVALYPKKDLNRPPLSQTSIPFLLVDLN